MPRTPKEYEPIAENLHFDTLRLAGLLVSQLPRRCSSPSRFARGGGRPLNNPPLQVVGDMIDNILRDDQALQEGLGLPRGYPGRFGPFLAGKCQRCAQPLSLPQDEPHGSPSRTPDVK